MAKHAGMIIAIEGINRAGKSTVVQGAITMLRNEGIDVRLGSEMINPVGEAVKSAVQHDNIDAHAAALMYAAARMQSLHENVPLLAAGNVLLYDRYIWSSLVYHGMGCGVQFVRAINCLVPAPAHTVLLDADPKDLRPRTLRTSVPGKYAKEQEVQETARRGYLALAEASKSTCTVIDATQEINAVLTAVMDVLREEIAKWDDEKRKTKSSCG